MVAYASQIVPFLLAAQRSSPVVDTLGTDIAGSSKETYNVNLELLCLIAMILKIMQDLHPTVVTDAALLARLSSALDTGPGGDMSGWPGYIVLQVPKEKLSIYGGLETDSVSVLLAKIQAHNDGRPGHGS